MYSRLKICKGSGSGSSAVVDEDGIRRGWCFDGKRYRKKKQWSSSRVPSDYIRTTIRDEQPQELLQSVVAPSLPLLPYLPHSRALRAFRRFVSTPSLYGLYVVCGSNDSIIRCHSSPWPTVFSCPSEYDMRPCESSAPNYCGTRPAVQPLAAVALEPPCNCCRNSRHASSGGPMSGADAAVICQWARLQVELGKSLKTSLQLKRNQRVAGCW